MIRARLPISLKDRPAFCLKDAAQPINAVKSIAMVGGLLQSNSHLLPTDEIYLQRIFDACANKNIPISRDVNLGVVNLVYDNDFLTTPPKVDMVVLSNIFYAPGFYASSPLTRQSRHAGDSARWHEALVETGARFAFNIYFRDENCGPLPNSVMECSPFHPPEIFFDADGPLARDMAFTYR